MGPVTLTTFCPQFKFDGNFAVIPLPAIRSQQIFTHAMTPQMSCHVPNFVAINILESRWERNEISIEFELRWKKTLVKWGPGSYLPILWYQQYHTFSIWSCPGEHFTEDFYLKFESNWKFLLLFLNTEHLIRSRQVVAFASTAQL